MINYNLNDSDLVRGRDIRDIIEEVNSNEIQSDNSTILVTKNPGGTSVSVVDQYGGGGGGGGASTVFPAQITSGGNGIYTGNLFNPDGSTLEVGATIIPTRATGYDLPTDSFVVAYKVSVDTLGDN